MKKGNGIPIMLTCIEECTIKLHDLDSRKFEKGVEYPAVMSDYGIHFFSTDMSLMYTFTPVVCIEGKFAVYGQGVLELKRENNFWKIERATDNN